MSNKQITLSPDETIALPEAFPMPPHTVFSLIEYGWRPYHAQPDTSVYENLSCPHFNAEPGAVLRPYWFTRGDIFACVGCERTCSLSRPKGFPAPKPIFYPAKEEPFTLTPQEMVARRHTLNVKETAYCLNVSERKVYTMIYEGELVALKTQPVRIRTTDVETLMNDFDE